MIEKRAASLLPLTPAVFHILLALADGARHGLGITHEVEQRTEGKVRLGPGTLYGTIKRMLEADLIEETDERPATGDDPRRRYYQATALGREAARLEAARLTMLLGIARDKRVI